MVGGTESFQQTRWQGMIVVFNRAQDHPLMHSSVARRVPCTVRCCHSKLKNVVSTYTKPPARGSIAAAGHSAWGVEGTSFTQSAEWETSSLKVWPCVWADRKLDGKDPGGFGRGEQSVPSLPYSMLLFLPAFCFFVSLSLHLFLISIFFYFFSCKIIKFIFVLCPFLFKKIHFRQKIK